jgi:sec-independent protein translocase protein TatC
VAKQSFPALGAYHQEKNLSILEHLEELRIRLIYCVLAVMVGMVGGFFLAKPVNHLLILPFEQAYQMGFARKVEAHPEGSLRLIMGPGGEVLRVEGWKTGGVADDADKSGTLQTVANILQMELVREGEQTPVAVFRGGNGQSSLGYFRPMDPFMIFFKTALIIGVILALPFVAFQLYAFVAPGLLEQERRAVVPLFLLSGVLFPCGAVFAYFLLSSMISFLSVYALQEVMIFNDIKSYLSFALTMIVGFGLLFELPVVILLLTKLGIVSVETLASQRKMIFVGIMIVAAIVTPGGDPITLMICTIPLYILFELALVMSRIGGNRSPQPAGDSAAMDTRES